MKNNFVSVDMHVEKVVLVKVTLNNFFILFF